MRNNLKKVLITGGGGQLAQHLIESVPKGFEVLAPEKSELDITDFGELDNFIHWEEPDYIIHAAAITRPMKGHETDPVKSIATNVIATSYIAALCHEYGIKLIYISTDYVYQGNRGNYKESSPVLPTNNYGWSKLGGECAVHMIPNSLVLRCALSEKPFPHPKAFTDMEKSFMFADETAEVIWKLLDETGVVNVGGEIKSAFDFAKESNPDVKPAKLGKKKLGIPKKPSMNTDKLKKILDDKIKLV